MRVRRLLLLFVAFALVVAACGDDDDGGETTEATTATTEAATTTEAMEGLPTLEPGVLTVGSDISFPPFEEFDASGEVVGFDADLVNEMASRLGLEVKWVDTSFDTIFTQLATGAFDMVASATTITAEREEMVSFSDGYFNANQALTVNTDETPDIAALADLAAGDSVAVQTGTTGAAWAAETLAPLGIEVREFPEAPDTYNALEGGQVTGVIFDIDSALGEAEARPGLAVVEEIPTGEVYGFPVNPENADLLAALNTVLAEMIADGFYQTTYDAWFDKPEGSILYEAPELPSGEAAGPPEGWPEKIVFGFVPSAEQTELQDDIQPFIDVLSDGLGIEVEGFVTTDYNGLQVAMGTGQADVGAFATLAYVLADEAFPGEFEPILQSVRFGSPTYHTQWMVHIDNADLVCATEPAVGAYENINPDTGAKAEVGEPAEPQILDIFETVALNVGELPGETTQETLDDGTVVDFGLACEAKEDWYEALRGETVGFVEETSTSGYAMPGKQLIDAGLDLQADIVPVFHGGDHGASVLSVYNQDVLVGVSYDDARRAIRETNPDVGSQVVVFTVSGEIPNDVVAARAGLPDDLKQAIYDSIEAFLATDEGQVIWDEIYGWTDIKPADAKGFDLVREAYLTVLG